MKKRLFALLLVCAGAIFLVCGMLRGEAQTVFTKAINVCMECIGIG